MGLGVGDGCTSEAGGCAFSTTRIANSYTAEPAGTASGPRQSDLVRVRVIGER